MEEDNIFLHLPFPSSDSGEEYTTPLSFFYAQVLKLVVAYASNWSEEKWLSQWGLSQFPSSEWTRGAIWNTKDFPYPVGKLTNMSWRVTKALKAFFCSGYNFKTEKAWHAFLKALSSPVVLSALLNLFDLHCMHASLFRNYKVYSDLLNKNKEHDSQLGKSDGEGEGVSGRPGAIWKSGYENEASYNSVIMHTTRIPGTYINKYALWIRYPLYSTTLWK